MVIKNEKGITLVALVITIIVMLILAGVSLSMTIGENGILTKAQQAKIITDKARVKELVQLGVASSYDIGDEIDIDALNNNLRNIDGLKYEGNPISNANKISKLPVGVEVDGYTVYINKNGNVTETMRRDGIKVGDYVNYQPVAGTYSKTVLNSSGGDNYRKY